MHEFFECLSNEILIYSRVFMRTGMREIPNAYGAPSIREPSRESQLNKSKFSIEKKIFLFAL
jgi:hypothetical protein